MKRKTMNIEDVLNDTLDMLDKSKKETSRLKAELKERQDIRMSPMEDMTMEAVQYVKDTKKELSVLRAIARQFSRIEDSYKRAPWLIGDPLWVYAIKDLAEWRGLKK